MKKIFVVVMPALAAAFAGGCTLPGDIYEISIEANVMDAHSAPIAGFEAKFCYDIQVDDDDGGSASGLRAHSVASRSIST